MCYFLVFCAIFCYFYAIFCCFVLFFGVLCYFLLFFAVLCYFVLYFASKSIHPACHIEHLRPRRSALVSGLLTIWFTFASKSIPPTNSFAREDPHWYLAFWRFDLLALQNRSASHIEHLRPRRSALVSGLLTIWFTSLQK